MQPTDRLQQHLDMNTQIPQEAEKALFPAPQPGKECESEWKYARGPSWNARAATGAARLLYGNSAAALGGSSRLRAGLRAGLGEGSRAVLLSSSGSAVCFGRRVNGPGRVGYGLLPALNTGTLGRRAGRIHPKYLVASDTLRSRRKHLSDIGRRLLRRRKKSVHMGALRFGDLEDLEYAHAGRVRIELGPELVLVCIRPVALVYACAISRTVVEKGYRRSGRERRREIGTRGKDEVEESTGAGMAAGRRCLDFVFGHGKQGGVWLKIERAVEFRRALVGVAARSRHPRHSPPSRMLGHRDFEVAGIPLPDEGHKDPDVKRDIGGSVFR
jgi:hypothetical protein